MYQDRALHNNMTCTGTEHYIMMWMWHVQGQSTLPWAIWNVEIKNIILNVQGQNITVNKSLFWAAHKNFRSACLKASLTDFIFILNFLLNKILNNLWIPLRHRPLHPAVPQSPHHSVSPQGSFHGLCMRIKIQLDFGSVRSSGCHNIRLSVRHKFVICLKHWILIFLSGVCLSSL